MPNNQLVSSYSQIYRDLKKTIKYHREMTFIGYLVFRFLQFFVPVLSAFLTGLISIQIGQNQDFANTKTGENALINTNTIEKNKDDTEKPGANKDDTEKPGANLILSLSIILTVVGSLNSSLKPAESAEWAANFSNKFEEFENELNLLMVELGTRSDVTESEYIQLLRKTNHNLAKLIDERNLREVALFRAESTRVVNEPEPVVADGTE